MVLPPMMACTGTPQNSRSITIRIATTSPMLNLALCDPLTLRVEAILNAEHAVTFEKLHASLFHSMIHEGGLTFTNIRTGVQVSREPIAVKSLSASHKTLPTDADERDWETLFPGRPHILQTTFEPEMPAKKWLHVGGFEDGETYEVGVYKGAGVDKWIQGSWSDTLEMRQKGIEPDICTENIPFETAQTARFIVKGSERDHSLRYKHFHEDPETVAHSG